MMITGSKTQEQWLQEMGEMAHEIAPSIEVVAFKGVFRFAIAQALSDHGLEVWESVAGRNDKVRRHFLDSVLRHASGRIEGMGATESTVASIARSLHAKVLEHISQQENHS
jgi:hypothetical protein